MSNSNFVNAEELEYLKKTLFLLERELVDEKLKLQSKLKDFRAAGEEMWNEGALLDSTFLNQARQELRVKNKYYITSLQLIDRYERMIRSPYFGRFDFLEKGFDKEDKIYLGISSFIDSSTEDIIIYDWRAPICSIYYRNEIGEANYISPYGEIKGELLLKRQYKIKNSELKYFFDSSLRINDEILQQVLSQNTSSKMRNIVETIQKEQDIIIRDIENELLMVQGVAGSGKTSIALHRIAFLLYQGLNIKLNSNNVIIISPNAIFSNYIRDVLPELGEEVVQQTTYTELIKGIVKEGFKSESRENQLEFLINNQNNDEGQLRNDSIKFKASEGFVKIINRYLTYYERKLIKFKDVYYEGKTIEKCQELKNSFLNNKIGIPMDKRLQRIENRIMDKIHPLSRTRIDKIRPIVDRCDNHKLEEKLYTRLIAMKTNRVFMEHLRSFTRVDFREVYKTLFRKKNLFKSFAKDIVLPSNIDAILDYTIESLEKDILNYEDSCALLYLKLKIEGSEGYGEIKQVVVDEAQDYYAIQYETFRILFPYSRYTVLGDFNQSLEREGDNSYCDIIKKALNKEKSLQLFLNKGYRSSFEINTFNQKIKNENSKFEAFERHESEPLVIYSENVSKLNSWLIDAIEEFQNKGYESIAIICKTLKDSYELMKSLKNIEVTLYDDNEVELKKGISLMPCYVAKGMEFDAVILYNVSKENYRTDFDKRLLYVGCTRAMHELLLGYTGEKSEFLNF
jgi:DNA helicase-2/ATP-dependent DNA helicase PcrA